MIKCCNCEEIFETEDDLSYIVEKTELIDGEWQSTDRFVLQGPVPEEVRQERTIKSKKGPGIIAALVIGLIVLLIPLILIFGIGFVVNQIKYGKKMKIDE